MSSICAWPLKPEFFRSASTSSIRCVYCCFCVAAYTRLGLVVASSGLKSLIDSKSAVSATTLVKFFSCSSWFSFVFFSSATAVLIIRSSVWLGSKAYAPNERSTMKNLLRSDLSPLPRNTRDGKSESRDEENHDSTDREPDRGHNRRHPNDRQPSPKDEECE